MTTTVTAPPRDYQQRMDALVQANRVRKWRAEMKRQVKTGERNVPDLLYEPPVLLESMKVIDLILLMPKVGRVKARKMLDRAEVSPSRSVGAVTERQRKLLAYLSTVGRL